MGVTHPLWVPRVALLVTVQHPRAEQDSAPTDTSRARHRRAAGFYLSTDVFKRFTTAAPVDLWGGCLLATNRGKGG